MWSRRGVRIIASVLFIVVAGLVVRSQVKVYLDKERQAQEAARTAPIREALWTELQPVPLEKCVFQRFGEPNDGGYVMCANLLEDVKAGYSYGIAGYDGWGCDVATRRSVPVHQYDCFDKTVPVCKTGKTIFHGECVGGTKRTEDGRPFDTILGQLGKNGDGEHHVVMKIDVEGAEWESLPALSDDALGRIDQLAMELHGVSEQKYVDVVKRLKQFFHVAVLHINNYSCGPGYEPFGGWAVEVLFVNKRLDSVDSARSEVGPVAGLTKTNPQAADCQGRTIRK